jgi:hypothetical protein
MTLPLAYLAAPYSHFDPRVRAARFEAINQCASVLMRNGLYLFSPISHTHPIALAGGLPTGFDFWENYDRVMLSACGLLVVLMLDGWEKSTGVTGEIKIATHNKQPIFYSQAHADALLQCTRAIKQHFVQ